MGTTQPCLPLEATVKIFVGDVPFFSVRGIEFLNLSLEDLDHARNAENFHSALERLSTERLGG